MINKLDDISNTHIKQAGRIHNLTQTHTELQAVHKQIFDQLIEKIETHNREQEQWTPSIESNQAHHSEILAQLSAALTKFNLKLSERITRLQNSTVDKQKQAKPDLIRAKVARHMPHNKEMISTTEHTTKIKRSIDSTLTDSTRRQQSSYGSPAKRPPIYNISTSTKIDMYQEEQDYRYKELIPKYTLKDNP